MGCKTVIAVDRVKSRIDLAKKLGATHTIDTSEEGFTTLDEAVRKLVPGVSIAIDTTGVPTIIEQCVQATRARGKMVIVGSPPMNWDLKVRGGQHLNVSLNLEYWLEIIWREMILIFMVTSLEWASYYGMRSGRL